MYVDRNKCWFVAVQKVSSLYILLIAPVTFFITTISTLMFTHVLEIFQNESATKLKSITWCVKVIPIQVLNFIKLLLFYKKLELIFSDLFCIACLQAMIFKTWLIFYFYHLYPQRPLRFICKKINLIWLRKTLCSSVGLIFLNSSVYFHITMLRYARKYLAFET